MGGVVGRQGGTNFEMQPRSTNRAINLKGLHEKNSTRIDGGGGIGCSDCVQP